MTKATTGKHPLNYADAGVNIDAGNDLVVAIKPAAAATVRSGVVDGIGGFGGLFDLKATGYNDPILVAATDGVGTKLKIAIDTGHVDHIGVDLVAMCVNDLLCQGAEPLFFLDYYATGALDVDEGTKIINGIAHACKMSGCALIGGESAEMPGMYAKGDFDLAGFAVGAVERGHILPRDVQNGDVLLGLTSDGIHSNGYSLVRKIVHHAGLSWDAPCPWDDVLGDNGDWAADNNLGGGPDNADNNITDAPTVGQSLLTPTRLYVASVLAALRQSDGIHALAHITGGGLTENIPRVIPKGMGIMVDLNAWTLPGVFRWMAHQGQVSPQEMLKTFNCGIGMVLAVDRQHARDITNTLTQGGETVVNLGQVTSNQGVHYEGALL